MDSPNLRASPTILLVEQEPQLRELVAAALKADGYNVIEASNPDAATDIIGCGLYHVDVLLTEIILPITKGDQLAREMLEIQPNLKFIFSAPYTQSEFGATLRNIPHHIWLRKPYGADALRRAILCALGASSANE